jgi:hypothetical protein
MYKIEQGIKFSQNINQSNYPNFSTSFINYINSSYTISNRDQIVC